MILIYRIFTTLIYPLLFVYIYYRKILKKEDPSRYKEKILISSFGANRKKNSKLIWFHAASIGEFKSIVPIIKELNDKNKNLEFLITTLTLSSSNLVKEEFENFDNIHHSFLPFDVSFPVFVSMSKLAASVPVKLKTPKPSPLNFSLKVVLKRELSICTFESASNSFIVTTKSVSVPEASTPSAPPSAFPSASVVSDVRSYAVLVFTIAVFIANPVIFAELAVDNASIETLMVSALVLPARMVWS